MTNRSNNLLDPDLGYPPGWTPVTPTTPRGLRRGTRLRWTLGVAALVIAVLAASIAVGSHSRQPAAGAAAGGSSESSAAQRNSQTGSAEDIGPVSVITADATCSEWTEVRGPVVAAQNAGWGRRDASKPRQAWDPARAKQFDAMGAALRTAADQTAILASRTPHRAMRELYGTFTSYGREYAAALPSYQPANDFLARTAMGAFDALTNVCAAADGSSSAILRAQVVPSVAPPTAPAPMVSTDRPARFLAQPASPCADWVPADTALQAQTKAWSSVDPDVTRDEWNADQRATVERTAQVVKGYADAMEGWGRAAGNPVFEDLAVLGAQYFRAYNLGVPTYRLGDNAFAHVGFDVSGLIAAACQASRS
jgi:hypothetical protein